MTATCNGPSVDGTLDLPVPAYGRSSINNSVFRRNALLSVGNQQIVAYFDQNGEVRLAIRNLDTNEISDHVLRNPMSPRMLGDGHQSIGMGFSTDGFIHVVGGAHGPSDPFYYRLAWPSLAVDEEGVSHLSPTTAVLSYPQFYEVDHELTLLYRDDVDGSYSLNRYDTASHSWQPWINPFVTKPEGANSIYFNEFGVDGKQLAGAFTIRYPDADQPDNPRLRNEDLRMLHSDDAGVTWRTFSGQVLTAPIAAEQVPVAIEIPRDGGLINQGGGWLGKNGVYWIAYFADDAAGIPQIFVAGFDLKGHRTWQSQVTTRTTDFEMVGLGTLALPISRPVVVESDGELVVVFRDEGRILLSRGSPMSGVEKSWKTEVLCEGYVSNWEPIFDRDLVNRGILSLYVQGAEQTSNDLPYPDFVRANPKIVNVALP